MKSTSQAKILNFPGRADPDVSGICERTIELFPWFFNGTLDAAETREVRRHLESCASCRDELTATADVWRLATYHPDSMDLALYCEDAESLASEARQDIDRHLTSCSECAAIVQAARHANVVSIRRVGRPHRSAAWMSLAASVTAVLLMGSYLWIFSAPPQHAASPVAAVDSPARGDGAMVLLTSEGWESGLLQTAQKADPPSSAMISAFDFESGSLGSQAKNLAASEL